MRFYIATGQQGASLAIRLANLFIDHNHELTYDWTAHGNVEREGFARMSEVAFNEARAVRDAELVIVLLPGGKGTHTELGSAIATRANKRIIIWSETGCEFKTDDNTCVFYYHPSVERIVCSVDELLALFDTDRIDEAINGYRV